MRPIKRLIPIALCLLGSTAAAADGELNCVLLPDQQVDVSSPVPGVVQEVLVARAQQVRGGEILARMEATVEAATLQLADARASTDTEVRLRRVEHEYDEQHRDRLHRLQVLNVTSSQSLDDAARVAEAAELRVRLAQDRHREAMLERERAQAMLALKTIRSPIDGVIVKRHKTVGEYVEAHPIMSVARLDPLRVEVITPLSMFGTVTEGMRMAVTAETDPDVERIATVTAVDAVADPGSGTFGVQLELPNPDLRLPAGIKCSGRFVTAAEVAALSPEPAAAQTVVSGPGAAPPLATESAKKPANLRQAAVNTSQLATEPLPGQPATACLLYEAVGSRHEAVALGDAARGIGADAEVSAVSGARAVGYLVVTPALESADVRRDVAQQLRDAGVTDLFIFERGDFSGRVSVGAYSGPKSAERRRKELERLGFDTEVQPRTRSFQEWQVQVRLPASLAAPQARAALAPMVHTAVPQPGDCDLPTAAAR